MPYDLPNRLGPYEIIAAIGTGGMGEVYRARDTRLGRDVAVKVLPESVSKDEDRLRRFAQEARAVAALNHPNILAVHDIGSQDGIHYIVTELLEGSTLRERLDSGSLSPRKAIEVAIQIAQGLASAHEKGILHRDLKPENLFITKDGRVKILDFGLAKQTRAATHEGLDATVASQTVTTAGMVIGTAGYMSPEQVRGEPADQLADIFAFGAVLYEMLSGVRAFQRDSSIETMNAILKEDPPELPAQRQLDVPPALQRIVHRCLEKDRGQRFQSAKDLWFALDSISAGSTQRVQAVTNIENREVWKFATVATIALLLVGAAWLVYNYSVQGQPPMYIRITFRRGAISGARFTPDGQSIVYSAAWEQPATKLYRSRTNGAEIRSLDLPQSDLLAVSHSGELAILTETASTVRLARVPLTGGAPRELVDDVLAADWSPDSTQLAVSRTENGKCRLEFPIGKTLYETIGYIDYMRFSPQGDLIAFMDHPLAGDDRGTISVVDLKGNKRALTAEWAGEQGLAWSPDGKEIWFTATNAYDWERSLYAVTRSGKQRVILGIPGALYLQDIAPNGHVLFIRKDRRFEVAGGHVGGETRLLSWLEIMLGKSVSRDGKYAVIGDEGSKDYGVYLAKFDGSPAVLLGGGVAAGISPDDKWVASISQGDTTKIMLLPTGVGQPKTIDTPNFHYRFATWARDGRRLVVEGSESDGPLRDWVQDASGGTPKAVTPEGVTGRLVSIDHSDYISARDSAGAMQLYPLDGSKPKLVPGIREADEIVGGSEDSNDVYVSENRSAIPREIMSVNIPSGRRKHFMTYSATDPAGIVFVGRPIYSDDGKQYIYTQGRELGVLYDAIGLK